MERQSVIEELEQIDGKRVQIFVLNNRGETSVYTITTVLKLNGDILKFLDKNRAEVTVMYSNIEKIVKNDMVDRYGTTKGY
jgi:hypothetical protein